MKHLRTTLMLFIMAVAVWLAACGSVTPVQPSPPMPTRVPASPTPTATAIPSPTPSLTPTVTATPISEAAVVVIALEDNGEAGELVGCGDSAVTVTRDITAGQAPIEGAMQALLEIEERFLDGDRYNALADSELSVDAYHFDADRAVATVDLVGSVAPAGLCDRARIAAQLRGTLRALPMVERASIFINGEPLDAALNLNETAPDVEGLFTTAKIFLVALEDEGQRGEAIGCGDSLIPVQRQIIPTEAPLEPVLRDLLSLEAEFPEGRGLYNALAQSDLRLVSALVEEGTATVRMEGRLLLGGECDLVRFREQLQQTVLQFSTVQEAEIFINGESLEIVTGANNPPPTTEPVRQEEVEVYLIALGDGGRRGEEVGCGDSVVPVTRTVDPTRTPLRAAINELINIDDREASAEGLYNVFAGSELAIEAVTLENGLATIELVGDLNLGGACDTPRVVAQFEKTARQFITVLDVRVFINGRLLEDVLDVRD